MAATRREALEAVERLWDVFPDMRLGQLLTNITILARGQEGVDQVWELENEEIVEVVFRQIGP